MRPPSASRPTPRAGLAPALGVAALVMLVMLSPVGAREAGAQASGTIAVGAIVGDPVAVTTQQALAFTTVFPGVPKAVSPVAGGANGALPGVVRIQGRPGSEVEFTLTLPGGDALRSGSNALPIDTWMACTNTVDSPTGCTTFAVSSSGHTARLNAPGNPPAGRLWVRLGATVRPTPTQPAGTYTGTVTLSAVYTGL